MSDPTIQSYKRSIYSSELSEFGSINLHDNFFNFGILVTRGDEESYQIPESVGRWLSKTTNGEDEEDHQPVQSYPLVPCGDVFTNLNQELKKDAQQAVDDGLCIDVEQAFVDGSKSDGINK